MHEQISRETQDNPDSAETAPAIFDLINHRQKELSTLPENHDIDYVEGLYALQEEINTAVSKIVAELHRIGYAETDTSAIDSFLRLIKKRDTQKLNWAIDQLSQLEVPASKE